jgi:outer membrane receptor protein involved in Fe transport
MAGTFLQTGQVLAQTEPAAAAEGEIIVTAQKRTENIQNVPISIQALGSERLDQHQIRRFDDYAKLLPSVSFQSFGPGQSQIYFRGVSSGSLANGSHAGSQPTSALYVDEVPLTTIGGAVDLHLYDIARVEALSGPQGTLYGASSLSGTLRIITNKPDTHAFSAAVDVSGTTFARGANSHGGSIDGYVNIPLSPTIALRGSAFYQRDGGYISNIPGTRVYQVIDQNLNLVDLPISNAPFVGKNFNDVDTYGGRLALGIDLDEDWTVTPSVIYQHLKSGGTFLYGPIKGDALIPPTGDLQVQDYTPDHTKDEWVQAALTIQGKLSNWDVTYAFGYFDRHLDVLADYSAYNVNYQHVSGDPYYNSIIAADGRNLDPTQIYHAHDDYTKQTHELRVSSPSNERFRLTAGMFLQRQTDRIFADYIINGLAAAVPPTPAFYQTAVPTCGDNVFCTRVYRVDRDYAMFADAAYDILPNLTLNAGIRGFMVKNTASGFSGTASRIADCIGPSSFGPCLLFDKKAEQSGETHKVSLSWRIDRDHLAYFTYSTGYRPGGINRLPGVNPYAADTLTNYELGFKTSWFQRRLIVNLALFQQEWHNVQYGLTTPDSNGTLSTYNVGDARIRGVEGDFNANIGPVTLSGSATYIDGKTTTDFCGIGASGNPDCATQPIVVFKGTRLPIQPEFKGTTTARYGFDMGSAKAYVQGTLNFQTSVRSALLDADAAAFGPIHGFTTADFAFGADMGRWHWEVFAQNAFDERGVLSLNSACIPSACAQYGRAYPIKPQQFGVKLGMKF